MKNKKCKGFPTTDYQAQRCPSLKDKKVSVVGFGRSGKACTDLLLRMGAKVFVSEIDESKKTETSVQHPLSSIQYEFGKHTPRIFDASLIIVSPGIPVTHPIIQEAKSRNIPVIGELEFASRFIENPIIAITGTNGKSTTAFLIQKIFESAKIDAIVCGNIGVPLSSLVGKIGYRTIPIIEVSTFQLETIEYFHPWIGVFLNISPDHLDRHNSFKEYLNLKLKLFSNQEKDDFAVLNFDDPTIVGAIHELPLQRAQKLFFSYKCGSLDQHNKLTPAIWVKNENIFWKNNSVGAPPWRGNTNKLFSIKDINLKWECLLENYLASILVAKIFKIQNNLILQGLNAFKGISHRLEDVSTVKGVKFINNSMCTNPTAFVKTIKSFKSPVILIAGGKKKMMDITPIADAINESVPSQRRGSGPEEVLGTRKAPIKYVLLIGETSEELEKLLKVEHQSATSMPEAVNLAYAHASPGDTVLLSPGFASFDWFRDFRERGEKFKEIVEKLGGKK